MKKRAFILILLMCSVVLVSLATFAEVVDIQDKNTALLSGEDEKPVISDELQSRVEETLNGFTGGFLENTGQKNEAIHYYTESAQMAVGFGTSELRFNIFHPRSERLKSVEFHEEPLDERSVIYTPITLTFLGSNQVIPVAYEPTGVYCHYFKGSDPTKWQVNNRYYTKLVYHNIYEQIDLVYELKQGQLKYEFFVYPGGKLEDIKLHWTEPVSLTLLEKGMQIQVHRVPSVEGDMAPVCNFMDTAPISYQSLAREHALQGSFEILGPTTYGFSVPIYDPTKLLIIDPVFFTYSTYVSGSLNDDGNGIAVDGAGNAYVTGHTYSTDFPTVNAYNATGDGNTGYLDAFVFKLAANGSSLLYSTYVSGSHHDYGRDIAVDAAGNAYVTGRTYSTDFPTVNAYNATGDGSTSLYDVIVFKLAANGSSLLYSTYVSGSGGDQGWGIAVDSTGNAYVTGTTASSDFPTVNAYMGDGGNNDVFLCKLAANGSSLLYSTYISGSSDEIGGDIVCDIAGNAYVTGYTYSFDFPTTPNAYNATGDGDPSSRDSFVCKLAADGSNLLYSTYVSGSGNEDGEAIAVDGAGNAYVTGTTGSADFPTVNAYMGDGGGFDAFVFKLSPGGNCLLYSTYVGGNDFDRGYGIAVDAAGNAFVAGQTYSTDFPTTPDAYNATGDGSTGLYDPFVFKLSSNGSSLLYSTYVSGSNHDYCLDMALDAVENVYATGTTASTDFPTTPDAYNATGDGVVGSYDAFVFKLMFNFPPSPPQGLSTVLSADLNVILLWDEPMDDGNSPVIAYRVYRSTTSGAYGSFLAEVTSEAFIDSTAISGEEYFYVVTAVNLVGEGAFSNEVTITVPTPTTPTTVTTTVTETTPTPGFEVIGLVIALTSLVIAAVIYRRRKNA